MSTIALPIGSVVPNVGTISVVHVVLSLEVGGLERVVLDLVRQGSALGQRVTVVCLAARGTLAHDAEASGARVIHLNKRPGIRLGVVSRLAKVFRELQPDIVHSHQIGALFYAGPAARRAGVGIVVHTEHGKHYATRFRTRVLGRIASRYTRRFFCVSNDLASEVRRFHIAADSKIAVLANGIDLDRFCQYPDPKLREELNIPQDAPVIGTIGRLAEVKRQDLLLRAFAAVRRSAPTAHLLVVGDGPLRQELSSLAANLGVAAATHFVGYQSQPERYLSLMNIFAITSRSEGMPLGVLEAWAAGLPVVASAVGGLPEMIDEGRTGLLFPTCDDAALMMAFRGLLENPSRAKWIGKQGLFEVRQHYSLDRMAAEYHREYMALLGRL